MNLIFTHGKVNADRALQAATQYAETYEADFSLVGAQSIANYVLPRESNGHEGYIRFPFPRDDNDLGDVADELRIYFSPRGSQPYQIHFVQSEAEGVIGFDVSSQVWSERIAASLKATGVVKRELAKPYRNDPLNG
jgi:hypothetical protein